MSVSEQIANLARRRSDASKALPEGQQSSTSDIVSELDALWAGLMVIAEAIDGHPAAESVQERAIFRKPEL